MMFKLCHPDASSAALAPAAPADHGAGWTPRRLSGAAACLALLAALALAIDLPVAQSLKNHSLPGDLRRLVRLAEVFGWGLSVAFIILIAARLDPRGWRIVPRLAACSLGAGIAADAVKLFVVRLRPSAAELSGNALETFVSIGTGLMFGREHATYGYHQQSFPSAHTATAAGLAIGLATLYPRGRWLFFGLAVAAGLQRVEAHAHFCSDVLAGAALGCLIGAVISGWPARRQGLFASAASGP